MFFNDLVRLLEIAHRAGKAILEVYDGSDFGVITKADDSPVTLADKASHQIIVAGLAAMSDKPIVSEEAELPPWSVRQHWSEYWLIDPLDGTREFIKRNGEFTVNIAYILNGEPVLGVIYVPVKDLFYYGAKHVGAFRQRGLRGMPEAMGCAAPPLAGQHWRLVGSRSHVSAELGQFVANLPAHTLTAVGSSLKFCLVAEGTADLYPRFGPTCEWDTAAAQAIVEAAGGLVLNWQTLTPLRYNTSESLLNPSFIACAHISPDWAGQQPPLEITTRNTKGAVVWFTGLSGAGKSTLAGALRAYLNGQGRGVVHLDGDCLRQGVCSDLGYSLADRSENVRRIGQLASLLAGQGLIVLVSTISPLSADRHKARETVHPSPFVEVYVATPLSVCESRDTKGLYKAARSGVIRDFTGIDSPYEPPTQPEATVDTDCTSIADAVILLAGQLRKAGAVNF